MSKSEEIVILEPVESCADELRDISIRLEAIAQRLLSGEAPLQPDSVPFQQLFTPLVKLYAAASEAEGIELVPVRPEATPTEVVMLACALLRARDLNPFDLALWFSRSAQGSQAR